jgi:hypothetical protein
MTTRNKQHASVFCSRVKHPVLSQFHSRTAAFGTAHVDYYYYYTWLCFLCSFLIVCKCSRCKRKTLCVCVCMCLYIFIDIIFWDTTVQAANMFSVPNAAYFRRNCEFHMLLLESSLGRVWGNWIRLILKIRIFHSCSYFSA